MTTLREAAQQALEALTPWMDSDHTVQHAAYHALRAALAEPVQEQHERELTEVLAERDEAEDYIDALLDEVLGPDRAEWSSAYDRADALEEVRERIDQMLKPSIDKAWNRFEAEPVEPVAHRVVAGALFDFMGWLTSRRERLVLSSTDDAAPAADAIKDFAEMRGLSLDDAKVQDWNAALAQQAKPQGCDHCNHPLYAATRCRVCGRVTEQAEPVAWRYKYSDGFWRFSNGKRVNGCDPIESQALYTAPPQRKPLPKHDQHCVDVPGYGLMAVRLVRAVERAHGIKENPDD